MTQIWQPGDIVGYVNDKPVFQVGGGSEGAVEQPVGDSSQGSEEFEPTTASEPQETQAPWAKYLEGIPSSLHPVVEQNYRKWDSDVTQRFQKVHSEYEPLKGYQPLLENGYDPQQVYQLVDALNNDPKQVYDALVASFADEWGLNGEVSEQGQEDNEELPEFDPKVQELKSTVDLMADIMLEQHRKEQEAQEDAQLDQYLSALKQQHGDFDEAIVLGLMHSGMSGEDAISRYNAVLSNQNRPPAPRLLGSGGGVPTESVKLDTPQARKQVIAQMLANAKAQS